ncbi:class I SAM-dependent methyltransferase [Kitasatospora sp. NPDC059571]|uniref:class I SAM-dependent methyltransferase n=1 Tax=Kitasatospora sp. NPDC059571 TaxID=3346871 RepID=UPI0036CFF623
MTDGPENGAADADYTVSVEFYDLLQAESDRRLAQRRFAGAAGRARLAVLDVGAGTGIVTEMLLTAAAVPIHAVEPSPAMRTALLSRLSGLGAARQARVTVHPEPVQEAGLAGVADLAVASNVIASLDPAARRATWRALEAALVPGGLLLFDPPPSRLPAGPEHDRLGPVRVGPDLYSADLARAPHRGALRATFTYRVERHGRTVREEREAFDLWPADPSQLRSELRDAGLQLVRAPSADLMAARRPLHGAGPSGHR